jgi:uncharacterized protein (TIGR03084 family)
MTPTHRVLDEVLVDLTAEGDALREQVAGLDEAGWRTPTPAAGWDVATQVAHLAWTDEAATAAATGLHGNTEAWDALVVQALGDPDGFVDAEAHRLAGLAPAELLERWDRGRAALAAALRAYPEGQKMPWFGPPMAPASMATARFMETWAHALDVYDALGTQPEATDRIRHVAHLGVRTRDFAFGVHGLQPPAEPFHVALVAPSGAAWTWGPEDAAQRVTGSAYGFCLLVTQRAHRDDTDLVATGPDAERWLDIAQAFAGPPGEGRKPRA